MVQYACLHTACLIPLLPSEVLSFLHRVYLLVLAQTHKLHHKDALVALQCVDIVSQATKFAELCRNVYVGPLTRNFILRYSLAKLDHI